MIISASLSWQNMPTEFPLRKSGINNIVLQEHRCNIYSLKDEGNGELEKRNDMIH